MENKRFIAGAACPACGEQDKVFTYRENGDQWRACVACDFRERYGDTVPGEELATRVNRPRVGEQVLAHEVPVEPVRILDPGSVAGDGSDSLGEKKKS